jgi:hypothetical protein
MEDIFKLLIFFIITASIVVAGLKAYYYFNQKLTGSQTLIQVLWYTALLIVVNMAVIILGLLILVKAYDGLSDV